MARRLRTLDAYPWGFSRIYSGREAAPGWLEIRWLQRAHGGRNRNKWLAAVREYTEARVRQGRQDDAWHGLVGGVALGEIDYAKALLAKARANPDEQIEARALAREGRIPWERSVEMAAAARGVNWAECVERCGDWTRDAVLCLAVRHAGCGLSEVHGRIPGLKYQAAAQGVVRIEVRRRRERECVGILRRMAMRVSNMEMAALGAHCRCWTLIAPLMLNWLSY